MRTSISLIIPNYNGSGTLQKCLEAACSSDCPDLEVVVVDDSSSDNSVEVIKQFPCKLVQLHKRSGASTARNVGAQNSSGRVLFFVDADCILQEGTLARASGALSGRKDIVIGGTYTPLPYDKDFFSTFQSIFVHYNETRTKTPDYIATHALVVDADTFHGSGAFSEDFLPILEDVEFSHRLRRTGCRLLMDPDILVQHIFNFTLLTSLKNALRKSFYWTIYSLSNRDLLGDSGTASRELKINVISFFLCAASVLFLLSTHNPLFFWVVPTLFFINLLVNRGLVSAFYRAKGLRFAVLATLYYTLVYPLAVGAGALAGMIAYPLASFFRSNVQG